MSSHEIHPEGAASAPPPVRRVTVMPDYGAQGLWGADGREIDPDSLAVTAPLRWRLAAWCAWFEDSELYRPPDRRTRPFDLDAFAAEGRAIAAALKGELGSVEVLYHDVAVRERMMQAGWRPPWETVAGEGA